MFNNFIACKTSKFIKSISIKRNKLYMKYIYMSL